MLIWSYTMLYLTKTMEIPMFYFEFQYPPSAVALNMSVKQNVPVLPDFVSDKVT